MPSKNRHFLNWLWQQFQLKPGKPAYIYGVRILLIISGPIAVGIALGQIKIVAIATISAFFVGLVNVNGTYRQQTGAIAMATIGITLALLLANLVSGSVWLTILTTFIVIFLLGLAGLYGATTAGISLVVSMMFIVALARFSSFPNLTTVLEQCLLCLAGGVWTMVLSAGLWLVRSSTPAIDSVADCYLALSKLTLLTQQRVSTPQSPEITKQFLQAQDVAIQNLIFARTIWTSVWTRDKSDHPRGNQLLLLIEDANQIINSLIILMELITISIQPKPNAIADNYLFNYLKLDLARVIEQIAVSLQRLATALKKNRKSISLEELEQSVATLEDQWQNLRSQVYEQTIEIQASEYTDLVNLRKIIINLTKLSEQLHTDVEITTDLSLSPTQPNSFFFTQPDFSWFDTLKNNFTFRSVLFRHALRLALVVTVAQLLALLLPIPRGYWIALTALVALKPNFGGTFQSTGQRVLGTCVGGVIGIVLVTIIHNPIAIAIIILLLLFMAISLRPLSYSIFITLLTPVIIVLLNALGAGDWEIGVLRIVDSLIGGALALLGSYLLFPSWERQQLPTQLEKTIRANLAYFQVVFNQTNSSSLTQLRHQAALENANAEAAAQRLFSEPRHVRGEIEPVMTLMLYLRSLFSSITTLSEHLKEFNPEEKFNDFVQLINAIEEVLNNLADALHNQQPPQPLPLLDNYLTQLRDRIERLHKARISEFTTYPDTMTPTLQAVRQQTPVAIELNQIVRAVTIMHCTIDRMQSNQLPVISK